MSRLKLEVNPLYLEDSDEYAGKYKLKKHQAELRHSDEHAILVEAPTSSGKTLAFLLRSLEHFDNTIILYPTNALMWDQARSISSLIESLGYRCSVAVEEKEGVLTWRNEGMDYANVALYVINGDTLGVLADENHSSEGRALLTELLKGPQKRIFLTNPEILYHIFTMKFAQAIKILDETLLRTASLLVVDEFHLYHGYSLAIISYLLYMLRKVFTQKIFTSATPSPLEQILLEPVKTIRAKAGSGQTVRHHTSLSISGYEGFKVLKVDSISMLIDTVQEMYHSHKPSAEGIKVVVIVNSVVTADKLASALEHYFPNEVVPIHGLVPRNARSSYGSIVVGTSAIEVGVDFDAPSLIFEARDSTSFIQRFGRGGRHSKCDAICLVPTEHMPAIKKLLPTSAPLQYGELKDIIVNTMPSHNTYNEFVWSVQGSYVFLAFLLSMNHYLIRRGINSGYPSHTKYMKQLKQQILDCKIDCPEPIRDYLKRTVLDWKNMVAINALSSNMSVRSTLDSIPAYFAKYGVFGTLSLQDIFRLDFETLTKEVMERKVPKIPYRMRNSEKILWVKGIREEPIHLEISFDRSYYYRPRKLVHEQGGSENNFDLAIKDICSDEIRRHIINLINYQPACSSLMKEDWRMIGLYGSHSFLAIGGDAFLADYLKHKRLV
ncbi:MAG: type I-D CRISPR-associated helicase Cas3' [Nitrososphaerales archaeon]